MLALDRRTVLKSSLAGTLALSASRAVAQSVDASEATFWDRIAAQYDVKSGLINAENGNWGLMARPVLEAYQANIARVNRDNSYFARREFYPEYQAIMVQLAERLAVTPQNIALTRGASEALHALIGGYNQLEPGQAVMMADLDYGSMQMAMRGLARREQCSVIELDIPEPIAYDDLIAFYAQAFEAHPQTKLLLLTHISHRTGLALPVREICEIARTHNIHVVVDAAHSWGQMDFTLPDLGADYVGLNLHKWMGAPIGVGALYIRDGLLDTIDPHLLSSPGEHDRIEGRVHTGTRDFGAVLTLPDAFAFHDLIGGVRKEARLRALRQIWVDMCRGEANLDILTPHDPRLHAGITSFRVKGCTSLEDNQAIAAHLLEHHNIFTVHRSGVAKGACVRITPALYNCEQDMHQVGLALKSTAEIFAKG